DIFVGLDNFTALFTDREYYDSVVNSFVFAIGVTALAVMGGLVIAVLANQKIRGLGFYRTALLWPYGLAPAVAGLVFLLILHPAYGLLPYFMSFVSAFEFR